MMVLSLRERGDEAAARDLEREIESAMHHTRGSILLAEGRVLQAADAFADAVRLWPARRASLNNIGHIHFLRGDLDQAMVEFRKAAYADPPYGPAHSNLLLSMTHSDRFTQQEVFDEHLAWAKLHEPNPLPPPPKIVDPNPDRVIRLGYLSPDFRHHPVAHFIYPVLANHDAARFEVTCYADRAVAPGDAIAARLRALPNVQFREVASLTDAKLFDQIRNDRIDVLIDLALHTDRNRIGMVSRRPAPIQIGWLAYMGTSGSRSLDYRITDAIVDPPGERAIFRREAAALA